MHRKQAHRLRRRSALSCLSWILPGAVLFGPLVAACGSTGAAEGAEERPLAEQTSQASSAVTNAGSASDGSSSASPLACSNAPLSGQSNTSDGVKGLSCSASSSGVWGDNTGGGYGVTGSSNATTTQAVWGNALGGGYGVKGNTSSSTNAGVWGDNGGTGYGVKGTAPSGIGVYGSASGIFSSGVWGDNPGSGSGVKGTTSGGTGVYGTATTGYGVYGLSTSSGYAVYGNATGASSYAGYFVNAAGTTQDLAEFANYGTSYAGSFHGVNSGSDGIYVSTPTGTTGLTVAGGSKNAVVPTSSGARLMYTEESTEVWFSDYGFGRLQSGGVLVPIDRIFAETVNLNEAYHVFLQAYGDAELYVSRRAPDAFEVRLRSGDPDIEFSYRVVAKRRYYEGARLKRVPKLDRDPNLRPH